MLSLKSKKISLAVLMALVSIDWYVELQTADGGSSSTADSYSLGQLSQHLPTLRIVPSSTFASGRLLNFADTSNSSLPFQELSALAFTTPLQMGLTQLSRREPVQQQIDIAQDSLNNQIIVSEAPALSSSISIDADSKQSTTDVAPVAPPSNKKAKADTPQAVNLMKLLALYSMLHR
ncbi:MAG TPA: hypothetical protein VIF82_15935 [Burkholderiaceae bacterium]|jgi:hypothetical protein